MTSTARIQCALVLNTNGGNFSKQPHLLSGKLVNYKFQCVVIIPLLCQPMKFVRSLLTSGEMSATVCS